MKKALSIFIILMIISFAGCKTGRTSEEHPVPLHQPIDTALKVELYDHIAGGYDGLLLLTLEGTDAVEFCQKLQGLYTYKLHPPTTCNEYLSCKIFYKNGDIDVIGAEGCFVYSDTIYEGAHQSINSYYRVPRELMRQLFSNYVHPNQLPATNEYYIEEK